MEVNTDVFKWLSITYEHLLYLEYCVVFYFTSQML
jgi:hypothetical protein